MGSIIVIGSIWVHYGYVFYHGRICSALNLVRPNQTIDKVTSELRPNGLFLTYVFNAGKTSFALYLPECTGNSMSDRLLPAQHGHLVVAHAHHAVGELCLRHRSQQVSLKGDSTVHGGFHSVQDLAAVGVAAREDNAQVDVVRNSLVAPRTVQSSRRRSPLV